MMSECEVTGLCAHAQVSESRRAGTLQRHEVRCGYTGLLTWVRCPRYRPIPAPAPAVDAVATAPAGAGG